MEIEEESMGEMVRFRTDPSLASRDVGILGLIGLVVIIFCSILIGVNIALSRTLPGGGDFFMVWKGARAFLFDHTDPYSSVVSSLTQELVYGRLAQVGENPYYLTTPFFLLSLYFPLGLFSDSVVARGIWLSVNEIVLIGTAFLCVRVSGWRPHRFFVIFFSIFSILGFYSVAALLDGSSFIIFSLLYMAILFFYITEQDEITGMLLVLTLFHSVVSSLFILLVIWKTISDKRWRVFYGFGMTLIILGIFSFLFYPGWIYPFVISVIASYRTQTGISSTAVFLRLFPDYGESLARIVTVVGIILLIYEAGAIRGPDIRRFIWAVCLSLAVATLLGYRIEMSDLVVLFPGLALIFATVTDRWRTRYWLTGLLLAIVFVVPWALYFRWLSSHDQKYYDYLFLFFPMFTIVGLYWIRWWFTNAPRTWFDYVRSNH